MLSISTNEPEFIFRNENFEHLLESPCEEDKIDLHPIQESKSQNEEYLLERQKLQDSVLKLRVKRSEEKKSFNEINVMSDPSKSDACDLNINDEVLEKLNTQAHEKISTLEELVKAYEGLNLLLERKCNNYEEELKQLHETVSCLRCQLQKSEQGVDQLNEEHKFSERKNTHFPSLVRNDKENRDSAPSLVSNDKENRDSENENTIIKSNEMNKVWKEKAFDSLIQEMFTVSLSNSDLGLSYDSEEFSSRPVLSELELKMKSISEDLSLNSSDYDSSYMSSDNDLDSEECSGTGSEEESCTGSQGSSSISGSEVECTSESDAESSEADDSIEAKNSIESNDTIESNDSIEADKGAK